MFREASLSSPQNRYTEVHEHQPCLRYIVVAEAWRGEVERKIIAVHSSFTPRLAPPRPTSPHCACPEYLAFAGGGWSVRGRAGRRRPIIRISSLLTLKHLEAKIS